VTPPHKVSLAGVRYTHANRFPASHFHSGSAALLSDDGEKSGLYQ
jgi:hypothetical protein